MSLLFAFLAPLEVNPVTNSSLRLTIDSESSFQRVHMSAPELHSRNTSDEIHVIYLCTRGPATSSVTHHRGEEFRKKNNIHYKKE